MIEERQQTPLRELWEVPWIQELCHVPFYGEGDAHLTIPRVKLPRKSPKRHVEKSWIWRQFIKNLVFFITFWRVWWVPKEINRIDTKRLSRIKEKGEKGNWKRQLELEKLQIVLGIVVWDPARLPDGKCSVTILICLWTVMTQAESWAWIWKLEGD